jgi:hypothetical protein
VKRRLLFSHVHIDGTPQPAIARASQMASLGK